MSTSAPNNLHFIPQQQTIGTFRVPYGYELWSTGTYKILSYENVRKLQEQPDVCAPKPPSRTPEHLEKICDEPVWIVNIARTFDVLSAEDEETLAEIACPDYHDPAKVNRRWLTRVELSKRTLLEGLAQKGFSIGSTNALKMADYFSACLQVNKGVMDTLLMGKRTGMYDLSDNYHDVRGFLIGDQWITDTKYQDDEAKRVTLDPRHVGLTLRGLNKSGYESAWLHKFQEINALSPEAAWLNYTAFAPALLKFVEGRTFIVHHWSRTGGGKTALLKFALSAWGDPNLLKATMNRTEKAFTEGFRACTDILSGFDELQSIGSDTQIGKIVYTITNERSRGRSKAHGGLEDEYTWRTVVRTTGEEPLIGADGSVNLGGQTNRVIELKHNALESRTAQLLHAWMEKEKHWGHAGPSFCRAIVELYRTNPTAIIDLQRDLLDELDDFIDLGERRIHLATIATAQSIFERYLLNYAPEVARANAVASMRLIAAHLRHCDDEVETTGMRGLRALVDNMNAQQSEWVWENTEKFSNVLDGTHKGRLTGVVLPGRREVWLVKSSLEGLLKRAQVRSDVCFKEWRDDLRILKINKGDRGYQVNRRSGLLKGKFIVITWDDTLTSPFRLDDDTTVTVPDR